MATKEQQIESVARMMAAAYWRGRLESMRRTCFEDGVFEKMIEVAAEHDTQTWLAAARLAVGYAVAVE